MKNDKCPMINERGYALIAMVFVLVSFISVVFLVSYPLIKEARDDTAFYIMDRKDYRFRKALFGEVVDQSGTKLAHLGGFFGDYDECGSYGAKEYKHHHTKVTARLFGIMIPENRSVIKIPGDYRYHEHNFWVGYRGKRYLHILPTDDWNYGAAYQKQKGKYSKEATYKPYYQPYAKISMGGACGGYPAYKNYAKGTGFQFGGYVDTYIEVKDYSEKKDTHELRLVLVGSVNSSCFMYFEKFCKYAANNYVLYRFRQYTQSGAASMCQSSGQKKLMIQVREDPGDPWITKDTKLLCLPSKIVFQNDGIFSIKKREVLTFRVGFYG